MGLVAKCQCVPSLFDMQCEAEGLCAASRLWACPRLGGPLLALSLAATLPPRGSLSLGYPSPGGNLHSGTYKNVKGQLGMVQ